MSLHDAPLLFVSAVIAGALNSVANATNTIALWPGTVASTGAYRRELRSPDLWRAMVPLLVVSFLGSIAGALLLLHTPQQTFMQTVPWLLLGATLLFMFAGRISDWVRKRVRMHHESGKHNLFSSVAVTSLQLVVAVYIGYFGAGAGILMLALFALMGMENIHAMNAFKTLMASCANGVAVVTFILAGAVAWPQAILMVAGAVLGGYGGAWYAQKLPQATIRWVVTAVGASMTAYFFQRQYLA
jgi:uncharacterized membrane protein YfcA